MLIRLWLTEHSKPKYRRRVKIIQKALPREDMASLPMLRREFNGLVSEKFFNVYDPAQITTEIKQREVDELIQSKPLNWFNIIVGVLPTLRT